VTHFLFLTFQEEFEVACFLDECMRHHSPSCYILYDVWCSVCCVKRMENLVLIVFSKHIEHQHGKTCLLFYAKVQLVTETGFKQFQTGFNRFNGFKKN